MKTKCIICNIEFDVIPCRIKKKGHTLCCSYKCLGVNNSKLKSTKIKVNCVICNKEIFYKPSHYKKRKTQNFTCSHLCMGKIRETDYLGSNNPNKKYNFDVNYFKIVDCEEKAYLLGWIASDGHVNESEIIISIKNIDIKILEILRDFICKDLVLRHRTYQERTMVDLCISSKEMANDICKLLGVNPGKKSHVVDMPKLINDDLQWAFIRGLFDGDGSIKYNGWNKNKTSFNRQLTCNISSQSEKMKASLYEFMSKYSIYCSVNSDAVTWSGKEAGHFLNKLYKNSSFSLQRKFDKYKSWISFRPEYFNVCF